jgi:hypothetical protein
VDTNQVVVTYPWAATELLRLAPPASTDAGKLYDEALATYCQLTGLNPASYDELVKSGFAFLEPRRMVRAAWLIDVNDYATFAGNIEAEQKMLEETAAESEGGEGGGGMMLLSEDGTCNGCLVVETNGFPSATSRTTTATSRRP